MISQIQGGSIASGAILIEKGTVLPEPLTLDNGSAGLGWASVANNPDRRQIEKDLAAAGWTFFYIAGSISSAAFGFERQKMVDAALKRIIAKVKLQKCNCLEIDDVAMRSFWGMPYVSILAHSRHIQKGMFFSSH